MEKRKKRDYLGARIYDVPTQGYGSELKPEPTMVDGLGLAVYKSPSSNENRPGIRMFAKGCSASGCPLKISLDIPLSQALRLFHEHNINDHDQLSPQHLIYLYRDQPTDPDASPIQGAQEAQGDDQT